MKQTTPKFSVITVCYNPGDTLPITIESVLEQDYSDLEYLIIDGLSTDGTADVLHKYRDAIDVIVSEPDRSLYDAMNKGLARATGEYVCFLNAGDRFASKDTVSHAMASVTESYIPDIIYGETDLYDLSGNFLRHRRLRAPEQLLKRDFLHGMLVCHQSFYARRDICPEYDLQYRFSSDFDWSLKILDKSQLNHNLHRTVTHYLSEGMTTRNRKRSLVERFRIMKKHFGTLRTILAHLYFAVRLPYQKLVCRR